MRVLLTTLLLLAAPLLATPATAQCAGSNILDRMPPPDVARLRADAARQPFHQGNLWQATRGDSVITLLGTYHLDDPRHDAVMARATPFLDSATALLVEAGPDEEAALKAQAARDPTIFVMPDTTLPSLMDKAEWQSLSKALSQRGIPGFMAAKFQPWYVSMLLAVPPCMMAAMTNPNGLDHRLIDAATRRNIPIRALESHDTVFRLFESIPRAEQIGMLRASLAVESQAEDYLATLADSYFAEDSRLIWELMRELSLDLPGRSPAQIDAELAQLERILVTTRNQAWIPVIEDAAARGPVLVAFGALHLPGDQGVLALLERAGFTISRLPLN